MIHLLSSAYLAPIHYYTKLFAGDAVIEERCDHYVKQTYRNRCLIATADGVQALTIPVGGRAKTEGGDSKTPMREMRLSEHGRWRDMHLNALAAAYERSPYFEYYADDFARIYRTPCDRLVDFNAAMQRLVLRLLDITPDLHTNETTYLDADARPDFVDWRERIRPKVSADFDPSFRPEPYWQVFADRTGFLPNLSIVDLLFNLGPESRIVLRASRIGSEAAHIAAGRFARF